MSDITFPRSEPNTESEFRSAVQVEFAEIERLNKKMEGDRREIERLRAETAALKRETQAIFARLT